MIEILARPRLPARRRARCSPSSASATTRRASTSRSSFLTFAAAVALTVRVIADGPLLVLDRQFFVDPFNVFLVALTAFVGFTTAIFSRPVHAHRAGARPADAGAAAALPQHVPALQFHDAAGAAHQQHGHPVGRDGGGDADDGAAGLALPHAGEPRGGVEVLHPLRRRHRAGAVRHDPALLRRGEAARRRRAARCCGRELDAVKGQLEPTVLSLAFVFLLVGYGTKVGLVPLHNWLPDAHAEGPTPVSAVLSGLLLNVALYAVVRCKVLVEGALHTDVRRAS